jgi:hypothetical protein
MSIEISMYLDEMVTLVDHMEEVGVRNVLDTVCLCICVEINTKRETVVVGMLENV